MSDFEAASGAITEAAETLMRAPVSAFQRQVAAVGPEAVNIGEALRHDIVPAFERMVSDLRTSIDLAGQVNTHISDASGSLLIALAQVDNPLAAEALNQSTRASEYAGMQPGKLEDLQVLAQSMYSHAGAIAMLLVRYLELKDGIEEDISKCNFSQGAAVTAAAQFLAQIGGRPPQPPEGGQA